jgi:hypothetical protein
MLHCKIYCCLIEWQQTCPSLDHLHYSSRYTSYRHLSRPFTSRFLKPSLPSQENSDEAEDDEAGVESRFRHRDTNNTAAATKESVKEEK